MSKMSRQDRQAYEQALKRRKKQSSPGKRQRTAYSRTSKSSTAGRSEAAIRTMMEMRLTKVTLIIEETADTQAIIHMIVIAGMMTMITMTMTTMMMIMITRKDRGEPGCRKILGLDTGERKVPQKGEDRKTPILCQVKGAGSKMGS